MSEAINIGEFYEDLMQKVRVAGGDSEAFFEEVCQTLEEDGEFEGYNAAYCERKVGSRKAECSGWGYEEARGRLNLFAACFEQSENLATFSREEIESKIKRLSTFLEYCHDANLLDLEQSADEYEMIKQVKQRLENGEVSSVCFYILSNLRVNRERLSEELSHAFVRELNCEVKLIDIEELFRGFKSKGGNFEVEGVRFRALKVPQNEGYESYLAVISAADLARIYDRFGGRLLEKNIRTFLQFKGGVNRGVRNTIKNAPHKFFAYNNGITAVADAVELDGNYIVKIKNFQVVNGAQSMSCVYDAFKNKIDLSQVFLQMKLCVERQQEESEFVSQIAQYSNTQNNVKKSDFFSNHPFHLEFKRFSRECLAPQAGGWQCKTRWFYERARGEYQNEQKYLTEADKRRFLNENPKSQLFDKIYLARVLTAFDGKPNEAAKSAQKAFIKFAEKVANDDNFKVSEYFFKECIAKIILFKTLEELAPRMRGRVYVAFFALALVGERLSRLKAVLDIEKIWQNQAVSNSLRQTLQQICDFTAEFLTQNGEISYTECGKFEFYQRFCKADFEVKFDELDILSQDEAKAAAKDSRKDAELVAEVDKMKFVHQFYKDEAAKRMWRRLFEYYQEENFRALSPKQKSDLEYFLSRRFVPMNEKQCGVLYQIYSKAKAEGANLGEI